MTFTIVTKTIVTRRHARRFRVFRGKRARIITEHILRCYRSIPHSGPTSLGNWNIRIEVTDKTRYRSSTR